MGEKETKDPVTQSYEEGIDPEVHTDFSKAMSYGDYLQLDLILKAQKPLTGSHDEMLFVIMHQATELWLKLMAHEVNAAIDHIRDTDLQPVFKMLARVSRIQAQIIQSWDVLSTLTPADYLSFRTMLGQSSGFQSYQYRLLEFALGNRNSAMLAPHRHDAAVHDRLKQALAKPSLYDEALHLLGRSGLNIPQSVLNRDVRKSYTADPQVEDAWYRVYSDVDKHWDLYQLAEKLVDLEDWFQQWRFRHVNTVERIIGHKRGTGGTTGVDYLKRALDYRFFPELWDVRTRL